ncbi:MAG TPA: short-chain dehydrogenase, partial [Algoriphagus sp.]|nr:short-chain dehydrogenase [Algoriphagus sp.]
MKFKDQVVLITGATSGIGEACAEIFGKEGAKIAITGRNPEKLKNTEQKLKESGIQVYSILADAAKEEDN